jgi:hypothetical protein
MEPTLASSSQSNNDSASSSQSKHSVLVEIPYEIIAGKQKSSKLLWSTSENQLYQYNTKSKIGLSYQCYQNSCKVRVYLKGELCYRATNSSEHLHTEQSLMYNQFCVINEIKTNVLQNKKIPLRTVNVFINV